MLCCLFFKNKTNLKLNTWAQCFRCPRTWWGEAHQVFWIPPTEEPNLVTRNGIRPTAYRVAGAHLPRKSCGPLRITPAEVFLGLDRCHLTQFAPAPPFSLRSLHNINTPWTPGFQHHSLCRLWDINHATPLSPFINVTVRVWALTLERPISYRSSPCYMQYDLGQVSLASWGYAFSRLC